jgi:hypothetical protein
MALQISKTASHFEHGCTLDAFTSERAAQDENALQICSQLYS